MCACVCLCVRACMYIVKYFLVFERFLAPCFIELLAFIVNCIECFHVNDEPESKFLYTETIKLYCIVLMPNTSAT